MTLINVENMTISGRNWTATGTPSDLYDDAGVTVNTSAIVYKHNDSTIFTGDTTWDFSGYAHSVTDRTEPTGTQEVKSTNSTTWICTDTDWNSLPGGDAIRLVIDQETESPYDPTKIRVMFTSSGIEIKENNIQVYSDAGFEMKDGDTFTIQYGASTPSSATTFLPPPPAYVRL